MNKDNHSTIASRQLNALFFKNDSASDMVSFRLTDMEDMLREATYELTTTITANSTLLKTIARNNGSLPVIDRYRTISAIQVAESTYCMLRVALDDLWELSEETQNQIQQEKIKKLRQKAASTMFIAGGFAETLRDTIFPSEYKLAESSC